MAEYTRWRSDLPRDVDVDCAEEELPESRVPTLGLHPHESGLKGFDNLRLDNSAKDSQMLQCDSVCDSGLGNSLRSQDLTSGNLPSLSDTDLSQTQTQIQRLTLNPEHVPSKEPGTNLKLYNRLPSVDEGIVLSIGSSDEYDSTYLSSEFTAGSDNTQLSDNVEDHAHLRNVLQFFVQDEEGDTQIHIAIIQGQAEVAMGMIDQAPDYEYLNIKNDLHQAPLHLAVLTKQHNVVRHLVTRGATIDIRDRDGNTPLHLACRQGDLECFSTLIRPIRQTEIKALPYSCPFQRIPQDPDIKNYEGETCLHLAAAEGHLRVVFQLLGVQVGTNVNVRDGRSGRTILHHAIESRNLHILAFLKRIPGVDFNIRTFDGSTPLHLANGRGYNDIAEFLIECGADHRSSLGYESDESDSEDEGMDAFEYDDLQIGGQPISMK